MLWMRRASFAILGSMALLGVADVQPVAAGGLVTAVDEETPISDSPIEPEPVAQFSVMKLKDPAARYIVTIAVANDLKALKAGDVVDFLVLTPKDRVNGPPDKGAAIGIPDPQRPTTEQVLRSLAPGNWLFAAQVTREDVRIVIERVVDRLEEPRNYPMVGMARLHKQHFKCTVYSRKTTRSDWPVPSEHIGQASEIVRIDWDRLLPEVIGNPVAEEVQIVGVSKDGSGRQSDDRLIVAGTAKQAIRLKSAKSSGTVFVQLHRP